MSNDLVKTDRRGKMNTTEKSDRNPTILSPVTPATPATITSVLLDDWWLVKAEKGLAVEGFTSTEGLAARVFRSAEISKRHTTTELETADGIMVTVCGSLNISRTSQNGFSRKVYTRFLLGFPFDWEEHAAGLWSDNSTGDGESNPLPFCVDDVPVTLTRDFIMFHAGDSGYCSPSNTSSSNIARKSSDNVKSCPTETQTKPKNNFTAGRRLSSRLKNSGMVNYRGMQ